MKKKYYWKVVAVDSIKKEYISSIIRVGCYKVIYKVGEFVKSSVEENGLMVFNTRAQARDFKQKVWNIANPTIFKAEVNGEEITNPTYYTISCLQDGVCSLPYFSHIFPNGTRCFPEVKLIKKSH